jgi:hypothetical protein
VAKHAGNGQRSQKKNKINGSQLTCSESKKMEKNSRMAMPPIMSFATNPVTTFCKEKINHALASILKISERD